MNEHKFCFIICVNDERTYEEAVFYISHLRIPEGYQAELMPVRGAVSMASGYNDAMAATDARYKIYMHQDVFLLNPNFLQDLLTVFSSDEKIAMVGVIGVPHTSPDGVFWNTERVGNIYSEEQGAVDYASYAYKPEDGLHDCEYADGMLLATSQDLPWKEELFDGWNFYDAAQGFEFRKKGWRVVVPEQRLPWCAHDRSVFNLWNYDRYRQIFMKEYMNGDGKEQ